jgi:hypothetical protein
MSNKKLSTTAQILPEIAKRKIISQYFDSSSTPNSTPLPQLLKQEVFERQFVSHLFTSFSTQSSSPNSTTPTATSRSSSPAPVVLTVFPTSINSSSPISSACQESLSPIQKSLFIEENDCLRFPHTYQTLTHHIPNLCFKIYKGPKCIVHTFLRAGFVIKPRGEGTLGTWGKHNIHKRGGKTYQIMNHFGMSFQLGRKDKLYLHFGNSGHLPNSYLIPQQHHLLVKQFRTSKVWIVKPCASSRGRGIRLITNTQQIPTTACIISQYVDRPLLIHGKKFDMRVYVLVTSFDPVRVYMHKEGVVRFCSEPYGPEYNNHFSHLTNYSINKKNKKGRGVRSSSGIEEIEGRENGSGIVVNNHKWSLNQLQGYFLEIGIPWCKIESQIISIVTASIASVHQPIKSAKTTQKFNSLTKGEKF